MGLNPATWIDFGAILKTIARWFYNLAFKDEIAKQAEQEKAATVEIEQDKVAAVHDQQRIDALKSQEKPIQEQIQAEQARQVKDETEIKKVQDDLKQKVVDIKGRPDDAVLRDDF
jgi:hypothetical protein